MSYYDFFENGKSKRARGNMSESTMIAHYGDVLMYLLVIERKNKGGDVGVQAVSQSEIGATAGLSPSTWGRLEKGDGGILVDYIANAAIAFGYSFSDITSAADVLCSVIEENGLQVIGYGYKNHCHIKYIDNIAVASFSDIQSAYTKSKVGRSFVLGASRFGGLISTLLKYKQSPAQFHSFINSEPLLRDATEAGFKL